MHILDICQVRLDFDTFDIQQPSTTTGSIGSCTTTTSDKITITSPSGLDAPQIPILCGILTGSHSKYYATISSTFKHIRSKVHRDQVAQICA